MAIAIDPSSPAIGTSIAGTTVSVSSFTPPTGSLLYIEFSGNTGSGDLPTAPTITDNLGVHLTYTLIDHTSKTDDGGADGHAATWRAVVGTSAAMTITVSQPVGEAATGLALKVYALTGADTASPVGAHGKNASVSTAAISQSYTAQATSGWSFLTVADWAVAGPETAGTGCTVDGSNDVGGQLSYCFARRTTADNVNGVSNSLNVNLPATSNNVRWTYTEIKPLADTFPVGWQYRKAITIDQTVIDADLTNFPTPVLLTSSNFTFANAKADGTDIRFTASDGSTQLTFERVSHDNSGQTAEYWVQVPTVNNAVDTVIYMYYGNASATDTADAAGTVWDANFLGVWHMGENPASTVLSHVGTSATLTSSVTTAQPALPTGYTVTAGDFGLIFVESVSSTSPTPATPSGWASVGSFSGGTGTFGAGTGTRRITVFSKTFVGGETMPTFATVTGTTPVQSVALTVLTRSTAHGTYEATFASGSDATVTGTTYSATMSTTLPFTAGDMLVCAAGNPANTTRTVETLTATGATIASLTERLDSGTTLGNDQSIGIYTANVTAGLASAAAVHTHTVALSGSSSGPAVLIRVRLVGAELKDWSGANNHIDTTGMVSGDSIAGKLGNGINVTSPDFGTIPTTLSLQNLTAYTISAWTNADTLTGGVERRHIVDFARGATSDVTRATLSLETTNTWALLGRASDADALTTWVTDASAISAGTWYYVGGVFDSTTDIHKLRVNGTETTNSVVAATISNTSGLNTTKVGTRVTFANEFWDGVIDELRISNIARSSAWLKAEYNGGNGTLLTIGTEEALLGGLPPKVRFGNRSSVMLYNTRFGG